MHDVCDVTLSVYPHQASLKNMPGHGGIESNLRPLEYTSLMLIGNTSIGLVFQRS
jgi:hypothetical protein